MTTETVETKNPDRQTRAATKVPVSDARISPLYLDLPLPGDPLQVPDQTATDYRSISQKTVYYPEGRIFNCQMQNELRELTVTGMKLIWDTNDELLSRLSGQLDLVRVVIVADSVEINMPVKFPQSKVEIYARELIFGVNGSIDITPTGFKEGEKPDLGNEKDDKGNYTGKAGTNGMDAQSIDLNVKTLYIPEPGDQPPEMRLFACGSGGQDGGEGGFLDLDGKPLTRDKLENYYEVNKEKIAPPAIAWESVRDTIKSKQLVQFPIPIPTTLGNAAPMGGRFHFDGPRSNGFPNTPKEVAGKHVLHYNVTVQLPFGVFYVLRFGFQLPAGKEKPIPLKGLDAYPYGRPGSGGKGGQIRFSGELCCSSEANDSALFKTKTPKSSCSDTIHDITEVSEGKKGASVLMKGAPPALDKPALYAVLTVSFRKESYRTARKPGYATRLIPVRKIEQEAVKPPPGADASPPEAQDGDPGAVVHDEEQQPVWIHEFNAQAALTYAKHACMLHNRELSLRIAQIYLDNIKELQHPLPPRLATLELELNTLLRRLETDLDIFGNQLGWVPHLSVLGSFDHFNMVGSQAFKNMYLCHRMKKKWDKKESKLEYLTASRKAITLQLDRARSILVNNHKEFSKVQQKLHEAFLQKTSLQGEIASLEEKIKTEAEIDEKNRAFHIGEIQVAFGTAKLIMGGLGLLTEVIPVGQPFLGLVGGTGTKAMGGVFDIVEKIAISVLEEDETTTFDIGSLISEKAAQYIKENQENLVKSISMPLTKELDRDLKATRKNLDAIGKETEALAKDKESLQKLLALPGGQIPEELERLFRLEQTRGSASYKILAPKEQKELANLLRQKISERISVLEAGKEKSEDLIKDLRDKSDKADALTGKAAKLAKDKQKIEKNIETVLKGMTQMKGDVQDVFDGVRSLCLSREDLEPKIAEQIEKLKNTVYAEELAELYAKIVAAGNLKEELLRRLERCQMNIHDATTTIQSSLAQLNTIDRQALEHTTALDHSIYSSLLSQEQEARSVLVEQLYYFGKSYQYRFLNKVETMVPDYYKLDIFLDQFRDFLNDGKEDIEDDIDDIYDMLFAKLQKLAKSLIKDVQHNRLARRKPRKIHARQLMDEETLQHLNTPIAGQTGKMIRYKPVVFNFIDAGFARPNAIKFRIADINLISVSVDDVEQYSQGLSFDLNFVHSGTSLLYDGDKHYLFRAQTPSERISWEFTVSIDSDGKLKPSRVEDSKVSTQLLQKLCGVNSSASDSADLLDAYMPGGSSDITIFRTSTGNVVGGEITDFVIEVILEELHGGD